MNTEYEATYPNINRKKIRQKLKSVGAKLVKPQTLMVRLAFHLPKGSIIKNGWARVRNEGDEITLSVKSNEEQTIEGQKEICLKVDNFNSAIQLLDALGCKRKALQETKREIWYLDGCEICIDEWPYLEPFLEIEGSSEIKVKKASQTLGFDYKKALFCSVAKLYTEKYGIPLDVINNKIPIAFKKNTFLDYKHSLENKHTKHKTNKN